MTSATFSIPQLQTDRLILRAPQDSDLPRMRQFFETPRSHMVGGPADAVGTWSKLANRLGHWALKGYGLWHIADRATGTFLGWAGFVNAEGWDEPELGWTVMDEAEGKGIAFEACTAARAYGASEFGLRGVISYIAHDNTRSEALATRLGAIYEREGNLLGKPCRVFRHPSPEAV